ncbi:hypothetical protein DJ526_08080, partial [Sulfolobus sp. A20-N-G8]
IILLILAIFYPIALIPAALAGVFIEGYPFIKFFIPIPLLILFLLGLHSEFYSFSTIVILLLLLFVFFKSIIRHQGFKF